MSAILAIGLGAASLAAAALLLSLVRVRAAEREYERLTRNLPHASVALFDRDLRLTRIAGQALTQFGLSNEELRGRSLEQMVGAEQASLLSPHYAAALEGETRTLEYQGAGSEREFWLSVSPVIEDGRIVGGVAVSQEITDRRQQQRDRVAEFKQRELMLQSMNEAYVAIDEENKIIAWNESSERTFGYPLELALGRQASDLFIPSEDHRDYDRMVAEYLLPGPNRRQIQLQFRGERGAVDADGRRFTVELGAFTVDHEGTRVLHTFMHDVSDRVDDEQRTREHARDLEVLSDEIGVLARTTEAEPTRRAICAAATRIAEADTVALFEPTDDGSHLRVVAGESADTDTPVVRLDANSIGVVKCFTSGEPLFEQSLSQNGQRPPLPAGTVSVFWVPVVRGRESVGVIAVGWNERRESPAERLVSLISVISTEAVVAIERAALLERLALSARTDELTKLPNRRAWAEALDHDLARSDRDRRPLAVAMIDLDHFKQYNDQHGHQAGDRFLQDAATAWREVLREADTLARYGGEEFALALPHCPVEDAVELVDRLRRATPSPQSCSGGVVVWDREEGAERLMARADAALYQAKQGGRDRTVIA